MNAIGNILWLIFGGLITAVIYYIAGLVCCITIIGIPFGVQFFKIGTYALWPFGREMDFGVGQPGCLSTVFNIIWILLGWWEVALIHLFFAVLFCITIVGIPFGKKHFVIARTSLFPFGQINRKQ